MVAIASSAGYQCGAWGSTSPGRIADALLPVVEEALSEQRSAIAQTLADTSPPEVEVGTWANDVRLAVWDWAEKIVRDFGK